MLLVSAFQRLSLSSTTLTRGIHTSSALLFRGTPVLCAEPLKKKKKIDPAILKAREERRRKKLEKAIRKLERNEKQLKPIEECEVSLTLKDEQKQRERKLAPLTDEIKEQRAALIKEWCNYRNEQKVRDVQLMEMLNQSHMKALQELRAVSEDLYQEAIQPDHTFIPFFTKMLVATPPIDNYESPDGEYIDISKKWE
ncbi:large ribosomal subunit protein mL40 [Culicoides brevitarsis]|uniref:large ribosomal subunit protein mL40 n=1 Tax=Culicoides brevitarsis TaxID=469753 RepID=UPI00307BD9B8